MFKFFILLIAITSIWANTLFYTGNLPATSSSYNFIWSSNYATSVPPTPGTLLCCQQSLYVSTPTSLTQKLVIDCQGACSPDGSSLWYYQSLNFYVNAINTHITLPVICGIVPSATIDDYAVYVQTDPANSYIHTDGGDSVTCWY